MATSSCNKIFAAHYHGKTPPIKEHILIVLNLYFSEVITLHLCFKEPNTLQKEMAQESIQIVWAQDTFVELIA